MLYNYYITVMHNNGDWDTYELSSKNEQEALKELEKSVPSFFCYEVSSEVEDSDRQLKTFIGCI